MDVSEEDKRQALPCLGFSSLFTVSIIVACIHLDRHFKERRVIS